MAHFYGNLQGNRGQATRTGTKNGGIHAHVRGWNIGARVSCYTDSNGTDHVEIWITSGSNGRLQPMLLADYILATKATGEEVFANSLLE